MSDPAFCLSVCIIVIMYLEKSTISYTIYHSMYYIISIKHFCSIKNLLKKKKKYAPCMDSNWKWGPGQLGVKGREGVQEGKEAKSLVPGTLSLSQKWGFAPCTSYTHRNLFPGWKEIEWVTYCTSSEKQDLVYQEAALLLCEAPLSHDGQKGIDFLEKQCFPGNATEVSHLGVNSIYYNEI